jgi:uncharacterized protein YbjT (DUF2867 family)
VRVLVTGAGGYIGGRLVPVLLERGHDVVASFSTGAPRVGSGRPGGRWWLDQVRVVGMDVRDEDQVRAAVRDVDAVLYLVHSLADREFAALDRVGAQLIARAAADAGVGRIVYLSGLVPDVPESELSPHIASRLEVERILSGSGVPTITARAAIVIGSGSTSFEIVRQVSERIPVQALPPWMSSQVQPVAVVDVLEALAACLEGPDGVRSYDVGGPERLSYAELLREYAEVARLVRPRLPLLVPRPAVGSRAGRLAGQVAGWMTGVPGETVSALMESLHHDMVCLEDSFRAELLPEGHRMLGVREAIGRSLTRPRAGVRPAERDPMGPLPGDPPWAGGGVYLFDGEARHRPRGAVSRLLLGPRRPW